MKKLIYIIALLILVSGCGNSKINYKHYTIRTNAIIDEGYGLNVLTATVAELAVNNQIENTQTKKYIQQDEQRTNDIVVSSNSVYAGNYITILNVCQNAKISIGSSQNAIDQNDICLMSKAAAVFGEGQPILMAGHNTRSLKYLYRCKIEDIIEIDFDKNNYKYKVVYSNECTTDDYNLYDINTGKNQLEYRTGKEILQIYTCYGSTNRWFVKAVRI